MEGRIEQVNISKGGLPKLAVGEAWAGRLGLEGDVQRTPKIHGGPRKALLLIAAEEIEALAAEGFPVGAGSLGENLTVRGLDFRGLREGMVFRAGGALIELTTPREPCRQLEIYNGGETGRIQRALKAESGRGGYYCAVVEAGLVRSGDIISLAAIHV